MIPIMWPFAVWGLDLVRPLKRAPGGHRHLLVAINKFLKWIEVRLITTIRSEEAVKFFTNIIRRFGVPNSIITDNGTQFTGKKFLRFYDDHHIRVDWAVVAHPQMNGQVEHANGMILQGIKPRIFNKLNKFGGRWMAKLLAILWSLRMTPSRAIGHMSFFMIYGAKAVLSTDLNYGAPRAMMYKEPEAKKFLEYALNQLDKARDVALFAPPSTSRRWAGTIAVAYGDEPSMLVTWFSTFSRATRASTSSPHRGRVLHRHGSAPTRHL
jgi:hypothetical protein